MKKIIYHYIAVLNDRIRTFSLSRPPRPDFNKEEIELITVKEVNSDGTGELEYYQAATFSNIPAETAKKYRWVSSYEEYQFLAALLFCKRFPRHPYSKNHTELCEEYSEDDAIDFGNGKKKLRIIMNEIGFFYKIKLYLSFILNALFITLIIFASPFSIYSILIDKAGFSHRGAIVYSIYFSICWLIFSKYIGFFNELSFKHFKKDFDKEHKIKEN